MVSACRDPAMDYMTTDFGADSSSRFPFRARINRKQTDRQTRLNALPHANGYTAGVGNEPQDLIGSWTKFYQILSTGIFSSTVLTQQSALRSVHPLSNERATF